MDGGLVSLGPYEEPHSRLSEAQGDPPLVPQFPVERQALLEQGKPSAIGPLKAHKVRYICERPGDVLLVAHLLAEVEALFHQRACRCAVVPFRLGYPPKPSEGL